MAETFHVLADGPQGRVYLPAGCMGPGLDDTESAALEDLCFSRGYYIHPETGAKVSMAGVSLSRKATHVLIDGKMMSIAERQKRCAERALAERQAKRAEAASKGCAAEDLARMDGRIAACEAELAKLEGGE